MRAPAFTASSTWRWRFLRASGRASGPSLMPSFMGSPIGSALDCSTNALVKSSNKDSATRKRLAQMQPSLLLKKRDAMPFCTAFAAQELLGGNGHDLVLAAVGIVSPAEGDAMVLASHETLVGDGDAMGISGQVVENMFSTAEGWLGVNDPVL